MRWQQENHFRQLLWKSNHSGPILDHVGGRRNLVFLSGALLLLLCVPGKVTAQTYVIPIPHAAARAVSYTASVSADAGWDVTVDLDSDRCELHCTYRRKPDTSQIPLIARLLPPVTTIHFYADAASKPETAIVDPAGITHPAMGSRTLPIQANLCLPGRKLFAAIPAAEVTDSVRPGSPSRGFAIRLSFPISLPVLPLRV